MLTWYLPSLYGDIRLESMEKEKTKVTIYGLSPQERVAMTALIKKAEHQPVVGKCWHPLASRHLDLDSIKEQSLTLDAPISKVQKLLTAQLKPGREQVSVVRFGGGKIQEITERVLEEIESPQEKEKESSPSTSTSSGEATAKLSGGKPKVVATTVAAPVLGCPAPDFEQAEVRAADVMRAFLTPQQLEDFVKEQAFVATGVDTGHAYIITSRHARNKLAHTTRTLYDLTEQMSYCVHDWEVPAAEEMLSILAHLSVPGKELYLRGIRDVDHVQ